MTESNIREFNNIIKDIENNETVQMMKDFNHHCDVTCYEHCKHVAFANYILCKKLKLDYISAARAGMLHDLFLYNWRGSRRRLEGLHAFVHPKIALQNAEKEFVLNDKEKDIILKHMWPVTLPFPKYIESFIITLTDKYCAFKEIFEYYNRKKLKPLYRYAYIFAFIIFSHV